MADTRYVEQTVFDLKRALDDAVRLGLLPQAAARAVLGIVRARMEGKSQEVDHGDVPRPVLDVRLSPRRSLP